MSDSTTDAGQKQLQLQLQQALDALNRNDLPRAESILAPLVAREAPDADALQLMGLAKRAQNLFTEAEDYYRRSLVIKADQPHVHGNLANVLRAQGRNLEAIDAFREAIRFKPNFAEMHLNLALAYSAIGNHEAAEKSAREALRLQPNYLFAKQVLATALIDQERPKEAEKILIPALMQGSRDPRQMAAFEHNLGVAMLMQQRYVDALRLFDSARKKVPNMPQIDFNLGNTLQRLGAVKEAVESYRRALAMKPLDMRAHAEMNRLLYRLGDDAEFLKSYDEVASIYPEVGELQIEKGGFLFFTGRDKEALEAFERAARVLPNHVAPHDGAALVHARARDFEAAIREHEIAVGMEPDNAFTWRNYAETLLISGDAQGARLAAEKAIAIDPVNQGALATWTMALRVLGDPLEKGVNDYENLVRVYEIEPPAGYNDVASFNRDLNAYLSRLHIDRREAIDQSLRLGTQTLDNIFGVGHAPVDLLRAKIDEAVADYIAQMRDNPGHPLLKRKNPNFSYAASWSARLRDCGFHTNHVHSKGWISSAYYVEVPDEVAETQTDEGWIKFGEPSFEIGLKDPIERKVQPKVGRLVLFPSYMWHGTVPFHSTQSRTTIAFDVVPKARKI